MKTYKQWTENDNGKLKSLYPDPNISVREIAVQFGRTTSSIKGQAFILGLRRPYRGTWTKAEDQRLRELFPATRFYKELLEKFPNRTKIAMISRVQKLGLKRVPIGKQSLLQITTEQAAYLAGFIDGEGTISFRTTKCTERRHRLAINPYVAAYNCESEVLYWIQEIASLGHIRQRRTTNLQRRPVYEWVSRSLLDCAQILRTIFPYLIIKRQQAELVLEFCENRVPWTKYTDRELEIVDKIRELNKRGP